MIAGFPESDARVVRAWSSLTARGLMATPREVAAYLSASVEDTSARMAKLRATGQLPAETLLSAVTP